MPPMSLMSQLDPAESERGFPTVLGRWCCDNPCPSAQSAAAIRTPSALPEYATKTRVRTTRHLAHEAGQDSKLTPEVATDNRALSVRREHLTQHRSSIAYASNELCRYVLIPSLQSVEKLTRRKRYLREAPRLVYTFAWQAPTSALVWGVNADVAGCRTTRRSTSGWAPWETDIACVTVRPRRPTVARSSSEGLCIHPRPHPPHRCGRCHMHIAEAWCRERWAC